MPWLQLTTHVSAQQAEAASEALDEAGAISVTLQDAAGEIVIETHWDQTPLWSKVCLSALLPEDADVAAIEQHLTQRLELTQPLECRIERVDDQDWATAWKQHYKPIHMGGRLWICPSWCAPPEPDAVNVVLDPGMAFGTGDHPTTSLCLTWLAQRDLRDKVVLDYGCGSGILAIAAIKLGAREAWAVDIDPQSLAVTRENAERNAVAAQLRIMAPQTLPPGLRADIVVANILAGALIELAPTLIAHTAPGTGLALSGLLAEQGEMVRPHYIPPFELVTHERNGWICLAGARR
jgi:ribosomal protein L11 methyltransferase